jgi:hypothetical protein
MEVNHFNIACCEPSLGNHFFSGFAFANAADVESFLFLNTGDVTYFDTDKFTTLVPYDLGDAPSGAVSLVGGSTYKDFWGIIRNLYANTINFLIGNIFYSRQIDTIYSDAISLTDGFIHISKVNRLGNNGTDLPFGNCNNTEIVIDNLDKICDSAFGSMTDCTIRLGSNIGAKSGSDIIGSSLTDLFDGTTGLTLYCSAAFASSQIVVDSLAANPTGVTIITY